MFLNCIYHHEVDIMYMFLKKTLLTMSAFRKKTYWGEMVP